MSIADLEIRLSEINHELSALANYSLRSGVGSIGYRSNPHETENNREWIQVAFSDETSIDLIVLIPTIRRDITERGYRSDGFPKKFKIIADFSTGNIVIGNYSVESPEAQIAPFIITCSNIIASGIRIEAEELSARVFDGKYILQLSEIMVFNKQENVALHQPVKTPEVSFWYPEAWASQYLVDGFTPYLMSSARGKEGISYVSQAGIGKQPFITIDLGKICSVSRIHLHAVDRDDTVPQSFGSDFGIPRLLRIEGATQSDFSDAVTLVTYENKTPYDVGPIIMLQFPETNCRYVRLTALQPYMVEIDSVEKSRIGFSEIEVFSGETNVALYKPVTASFGQGASIRTLSLLTDGSNLYGKILPVKTWLCELAKRYDLETERPFLIEELTQRYARQKIILTNMVWLVVLLTTGTLCIILIDRSIKQRAVFKTRERIAADLHDELGANLHAIGLLSDLVQGVADSQKQKQLLQRMRILAERTGTAARYCTNMLEATELYGDLPEDMRRTAGRILADIDHKISFKGKEHLTRLSYRRRVDLFMFYKECLTNVLRHSGATEAEITLIATERILQLTVTDNGNGDVQVVPNSLLRRAKFLRGRVQIQHPERGGLSVVLKVTFSKFRRHLWQKK